MCVIDNDYNASRIISPNIYPLSIHFLAEQARWEGKTIEMVSE